MPARPSTRENAKIPPPPPAAGEARRAAELTAYVAEVVAQAGPIPESVKVKLALLLSGGAA